MFASEESYSDFEAEKKARRSGLFLGIGSPTTRGRCCCRRSTATSLDDLQVFQPRAQVAVLRVLALEFDLQAQVVHGVGVPQRVLVGDHVGLEEVEERLVEGLHAELARAADERLH